MAAKGGLDSEYLCCTITVNMPYQVTRLKCIQIMWGKIYGLNMHLISNRDQASGLILCFHHHNTTLFGICQCN